MACCNEPGLLPLDEALAHMQARVRPVHESEGVPLVQLLDRVLDEAVHAGFNVPGYDNSAMDGYALRAQDTGRPLVLIGESLAGHSFEGRLGPGECVRITTGACLPEGADAVVIQENTRSEADRITITQTPCPGENVRRAGEDIAKDSQVFSAGHRLGPVDIALLASLGRAEAKVKRRLKLAILSTGDELTPPGEKLYPGRIYDSNRYGLMAMLQRLNVEVMDLGLIPDQPAAIRTAFENAGREADAIISSGGVSVGQADYVKDILAELGKVNFWKVAIKPGKPFAFGSLGKSVFFGLPGNPVSAMVTMHQLALPIIRAMSGENLTAPLTLNATADTPYKKRPGRQDFQRARLSLHQDGNRVRSTGTQGSGVLTSFLGANAYAVLEQERGRVEPGETVRVIPFDRFL